MPDIDKTLSGIRWIETMLEAIAAGDDDRMKAMIHPNFVMHEDAGMPYGGVFRGPDGFAKVVKSVFGLWRDMSLERLFTFEDPSRGAVSVVYRLTGRPGKSEALVETFLNEVWTIREGLGTEAIIWYWDTPRLADAIAG